MIVSVFKCQLTQILSLFTLMSLPLLFFPWKRNIFQNYILIAQYIWNLLNSHSSFKWVFFFMKIFKHGMTSVATTPSTIRAILLSTKCKKKCFLVSIKLAFYQQYGVMSSLNKKKCCISFIAKVFPLAVYIITSVSQIIWSFTKWRATGILVLTNFTIQNTNDFVFEFNKKLSL